MNLQKYGAIAAFTEALTYIFGFVVFFIMLNTSGIDTPEQYLDYMLANRDTYYIGYLVIGVLFSFALIVLVQAISQRFKGGFPELSKYTASIGYLWAIIVLASSFIFLTSLSAVAKYYAIDPTQALIINRTIGIVVDALGGGNELVGAAWVLLISYMGLKSKVYHSLLHYLGVLVGLAGMLTLCSGFSTLADNPFFSVTTDIFGLGQIVWFIALGVCMLRS
ncbi:hypothetical protein ACSLBF_12380 [Pseudoalteromonas sp. T1lg65]|uniref:hypothetical protein n=1 Tax=Pseudoalteromonas sp. T1lg65 TaxID=2077101 RepID=UPI003F7AAFF1